MGHRKPEKSWNFRISFPRPVNSWNLGVAVGHGKSWKMMFVIKKYMSKINIGFFCEENSKKHTQNER